MQVVVPPVGTALREMFRREESEGHCFRLRPLSLQEEEAFAEPKPWARPVEVKVRVSQRFNKV
jgi:hypothetical protein